jgi:hypothetical protein
MYFSISYIRMPDEIPTTNPANFVYLAHVVLIESLITRAIILLMDLENMKMMITDVSAATTKLDNIKR